MTRFVKLADGSSVEVEPVEPREVVHGEAHVLVKVEGRDVPLTMSRSDAEAFAHALFDASRESRSLR